MKCETKRQEIEHASSRIFDRRRRHRGQQWAHGSRLEPEATSVRERAAELRQKHQGDHAAYLIELVKVMKSIARNDDERREAKRMLKEMRTFRLLGLFEKRRDEQD
jgi:hypothetical protein